MKHFWYLLVLGWAAILTAGAQNWQPTTAPNSYYDRAAMSADGSKQFATSYLFYSYYFSTNYGGIWTSNQDAQTFPQSAYNSIATSADGSIVLAGGITNWLYVSTNSGLTWYSNTVTGVNAWGALASSADGSKLFAAAGSGTWPAGAIYCSTNLGGTWDLTGAPTNVWIGLATSVDGKNLVAISGGGGIPGAIYTSTNAGSTWVQAANSSNYWQAVASSADGTRLVAATFKKSNGVPGYLYTSIDSGLTWKSNNVPSDFFASVALSADGTKLLAGATLGSPVHTYFSTDFGATWSSNNVPPSGNSVGVAISADGGLLLAAPLGGQLYEARAIVNPVLSVSSSGQDAKLGWTIPSTNFVLQQSADLKAWVVVTNVPVLNFTNLQERVTVPATNGAMFYRLVTP